MASMTRLLQRLRRLITNALGHTRDLWPDIRRAYGEKRLVAFGLLEGEVVVMVYTERSTGPRIISLRRAEKYETRYYFKVAKDYFK